MERKEGSENDDASPRDDVSPLTRWTEERERYDEIAEYIKQVDEILDFIKPFPRERCPETGGPLRRSHSQDASDHLENLIKLVEQLKDLKEKDSKMNERTQYLKDLKKIRERKKLLKCEAEASAYWGEGKVDDGAAAAAAAAAEEEDEETAAVGRIRSSLAFRKTMRGRSKSVNADEIGKDARFRRERFPYQEERKLSTGSQKTDKSKVSKWTKVKEAFRWERASVDGKGTGSRRGGSDDVQYLQVPQDKTPESLSDSPLSGQVSGSSSVGAPSTICLAVSSGYSGEHSSEGHSTSSGCGMDLPPPPPPLPVEDDFLSLPLGELSSSSSSEKLDELLTYSELLTKGNDRSDLIAAESFDVAFHDDPSADDLDARRSKSLDGDAALGQGSSLPQHLSKESLTFSKTSKTHKTAWGKVKDIIQTRKGSLKKKPKKRDGEKGSDAFSSQSGLDLEGQEDPSSPEDRSKEASLSLKPRIELTESTEEVVPPLPSPKKPNAPDSVSKRRLTPVLTITLPSTEELRNIPPTEGETAASAKPAPEDKGRVGGESLDYFEDIPRYEKSKTGSYHRFSKWSKVKRAFLTNPRSTEYVPEASSVPSSPIKQMSFFSDVESDELSSGEWTDYKAQSQEKSHAEAESPGPTFQDDIQKHYLELNHKLTQEFDQKLREWERMKGAAETKTAKTLQKQKSEDWDKGPRAGARQRDSMAIPLPKLDDLSPEFKKKLDEWKKIKKSQTLSAVPGTPPKDETAQGQNFKMRIGEWQRWRPRGNHKMTKSEQSEDFAKKLEEWQRMKGGGARRSRSQSERGKEESGNRTPSPRLRRKNSKKGSGKSSGTESLSGSLKEKDGRGGSRKQHKEKDLHWLEKELHKIERGKMRLEREKEKFLEREARLEKMKRTMGTTSPTQEILIKTPTGFFRFEGISQKFTKKLYEWEKARGIAPEASTFALLEEYVNRKDRESNGMSLQRSKSMGSVMEVSSAVQDLPHHPSSLSLNDVDELGGIEGSRGSSEPTLPGMSREEDEPQAIIVDVEDVVEETAALMDDEPVVRGEVPVYSYAPSEVTQLIDSSGSESETEMKLLRTSREEVKPEVMSASTRKPSDETAGEECGTDSAKHSPGFPEGLNQQEAVTRVHELSSQLLCLAEKLELALNDRSEDGKTGRSTLYSRRRQANCLTAGGDDAESKTDWHESRNPSLQELEQLPSLITNKVLELKSGLNVLKSATESPSRDSPVFEFPVRRRGSQEGAGEGSSPPKSPHHARKLKREEAEEERSRGLEKSKAQVLYGETAARDYDKHRGEAKNSPELIKRKIKEKISLMQRMTTETRTRNFKPFEFDRPAGEGETATAEAGEAEEKVVVVRNGGRQKKLLKTRRVTDTTIAYKQVVEENRTEEATESRGKSSCAIPVSAQRFAEAAADKAPVNVFVPTTRKIISPVRRDSKGTPSILSYVIDDIAPKEEAPPKPSASPGVSRKATEAAPPRERSNRERHDIGIPPLPSSPLSPRKLTSPGIRMMIAKYNQKIEQGSGGDGGTSSPSWRSPILERKPREPVQKSASVGLIASDERKPPPEQPKGILKSSSAGAVKDEPEATELSLRALRIKKAKEEFLSRGPGGDSYSSTSSTPAAEPAPNRLSHVSVGSESSYDETFDSNLIKSASAGAINVDDGSRRSSDVERSEEGRAPVKTSSKFGISSIRSRFRKVRMKKGKERGGAGGGAVSTLCRQSLLLEVPIGSERLSDACTSKSCPSSPVLERGKTKSDNWRRMFKKDPKPEAP